MNFDIRIANAGDWDAIAELNHDTFSVELGQYQPSENGRKTDRLHTTNLYIVAYNADELVGMLSMTLPNTAHISTFKRIKTISNDIRNNLHKTAEIRLLAIKPAYRRQGLFDRLILAVLHYCDQHGIERIIMSGIENKVPLYQFMGFKTVSAPVREGQAVYHPMMLTRQQFEASPFRQKLAKLEANQSTRMQPA
ncbi:MAG: GNAT family N-acetyltransferase [Chloroflexota bacterium]